MTVSLTMERYFSVVCPFKQFRNKWMRSSFMLSFPGLLFSILFTLPNYFQLETVMIENITETSEEFWRDHGGYPNLDKLRELSEENPTYLHNTETNIGVHPNYNGSYLLESSLNSFHLILVNQTFHVVDPVLIPDIKFAEFRENPLYIKVYVMWLHLIFNTMLPLTMLMVLNVAIYRRLNKISYQASDTQETRRLPSGGNWPLRRSTESNLRKRERRLARISLLIVLIFVICHSIKNIPNIFEILGKDPRLVPVCAQLLLVGHLLLTINSSVNFLIYSLGNARKVARILLNLCGWKMRDYPRSPLSDPPTLSTQVSETVFSHSWTERRETSLVVTSRTSCLKHRRGESERGNSQNRLSVPRQGRRGSSCKL